MTGEVLKSFLVSLGFDIDESGLSKFNKSVAEASVKVLAIGTAIEATAVAIGYGIAGISKDFEELGYQFHIIAPAINKALVLRRELLKAYSLAGVNITKVIQNSVKLNYSLAKTGFAFKAIYDSVGSRFFGLITKQSDVFREKLYKNMPVIQNTLERMVQFVFKGFEAITTLGERLWSILSRVYDFFVELHRETQGWSTIVFALIAAWQLLNLSFLASPLGIILSLGAALLALYDDYRTFQEGGKSLFDWTSFVPAIKATEAAISSLTNAMKDLFEVLFAIGDAFYRLITLDFKGFWTALKLGAESLYNATGHLGGAFTNFTGVTGGLLPQASPLGSNTNNSQTNQNVQLQSQTIINGTADAAALNSLSNSNQKNNAMLVRNLRGSIQPSN